MLQSLSTKHHLKGDSNMDYLKILGLSSLSIIVLFILTKIMGNREMSQMSMFDYVISITIGSIAAEMATALDTNFLEPLIAMTVYAIITLVISTIASKSIPARRIINGKSLILINNGRIYKENFKKAKIDLSEFLAECRNKGYFNIADIQTAILEANGKISILPIASKKPVAPEDLNITPKQEKTLTTLILDGEILSDNLEHINKTKTWLYQKLQKQNYPNERSIFLATIDNMQNLTIYDKITTKSKRDKFI